MITLDRPRTDHDSLTVTPMPGALGAEIAGVDASRTIAPSVAAALRQALLDHQLIVLRDQSLTPDDQLAFAGLFGPIDTYPFAEHMPGHPGVVAVTKEPSTELNFGGVWHRDSPYLEVPPMLTVLYGVDIPPTGGDTMFANMYDAYDALPADTRSALDERRGVFSACCVQMNDELKLGDVVRRRDPPQAMAERIHPMVPVHPETGRRSLFFSRVHVQRFDGMSEEESAPLLDRLAEMTVRPELTTRLTWQPGTLVVWDNRCVIHCALNDYPGHRREVHRVLVAGPRLGGMAGG